MWTRNMHVVLILVVAALQSACGTVVAEPIRPDDLVAYIRYSEKAEIRESWGEETGECFTWADFYMFVKTNRPKAVADQWKTTPAAKKVVELIRAMPRAERNELLARARNSARPTWAMIGRISAEGT